MGARGPLQFPTAVKARRGTARPDRQVPNEPVLPVCIPKRPEWLSVDAAAMYDELAVTLCAAKLLTAADGAPLARLCSYRTLLNALLKDLTAENAVQNTTHGGEAPSGAVKVAMTLEEKVKNLEDRFGLNPAARSRISVPKDSTDGTPNEAADFA